MKYLAALIAFALVACDQAPPQTTLRCVKSEMRQVAVPRGGAPDGLTVGGLTFTTRNICVESEEIPNPRYAEWAARQK